MNYAVNTHDKWDKLLQNAHSENLIKPSYIANTHSKHPAWKPCSTSNQNRQFESSTCEITYTYTAPTKLFNFFYLILCITYIADHKTTAIFFGM
jgi:hypothetical protein